MDMNNSLNLLDIILIAENEEDVTVRLQFREAMKQIVQGREEEFKKMAQPFVGELVEFIQGGLNEDGTIKTKEEE